MKLFSYFSIPIAALGCFIFLVNFVSPEPSFANKKKGKARTGHMAQEGTPHFNYSLKGRDGSKVSKKKKKNRQVGKPKRSKMQAKIKKPSKKLKKKIKKLE